MASVGDDCQVLLWVRVRASVPHIACECCVGGRMCRWIGTRRLLVPTVGDASTCASHTHPPHTLTFSHTGDTDRRSSSRRRRHQSQSNSATTDSDEAVHAAVRDEHVPTTNAIANTTQTPAAVAGATLPAPAITVTPAHPLNAAHSLNTSSDAHGRRRSRRARVIDDASVFVPLGQPLPHAPALVRA
jgi:hypothetical protein